MHAQGNKPYSDLYSQVVSLPGGAWTRVEIPLVNLQPASQSRQIDLTAIRGLGFFVEKEEKPLALYLDTVRLE